MLSNSEKDRRNKELAQKNCDALQAMRDKCQVVITPVEDTPNAAALLLPEKYSTSKNKDDSTSSPNELVIGNVT